ncbi:DUF4184 family protein [Streptomyces sp. NRRL B-24484]|uniref:DUF4184 family protein n=1 Tax=Streptomyces sp. NRRL B-24484 TaxID=1463833 RepID=UPI0004BF6CD3|nr:DUF4184 family protein [Streptomyces sp. NRRL B-24484]
MPFTLSHPAAVLPLIVRGRGRGPLVAAALVAGSTAPDVPYFADSVVPGTFGLGTVTHAWWGVPTVDVLVAAALVGLWELLLREPLPALLPARWAARLPAGAPRRSGGALRRTWWFAVSAALGAATHVGWDGFTHPGRFGVRLFPVLDRPVLAGRPLHAVLQYGTSAVALAVLAWWLLRGFRRRAGLTADGPLPRPVPVLGRRARWAVYAWIVLAAAVGTALRIVQWSGGPGAEPGYELVPTVAFGSLAGAGLALLCYGALRRLTAGKALARRFDRAA